MPPWDGIEVMERHRDRFGSIGIVCILCIPLRRAVIRRHSTCAVTFACGGSDGGKECFGIQLRLVDCEHDRICNYYTLGDTNIRQIIHRIRGWCYVVGIVAFDGPLVMDRVWSAWCGSLWL
jgi:hypothetical protein